MSSPINQNKIIPSQLARITYKNGITMYGCFKIFADFQVLKENNKYRFVCSDKTIEFKESSKKKNDLDFAFSIVVDFKEVKQIEYLRPK